MTTKIKPVEDRVVVKRDAAESLSPGGIIIPEKGKEPPKQGTVVAVGPGRVENGTNIPVPFGVGARIIFSSFAGTEIKVDDEDLLIMGVHEVLCVVEEE